MSLAWGLVTNPVKCAAASLVFHVPMDRPVSMIQMMIAIQDAVVLTVPASVYRRIQVNVPVTKIAKMAPGAGQRRTRVKCCVSHSRPKAKIAADSDYPGPWSVVSQGWSVLTKIHSWPTILAFAGPRAKIIENAMHRNTVQPMVCVAMTQAA